MLKVVKGSILSLLIKLKNKFVFCKLEILNLSITKYLDELRSIKSILFVTLLYLMTITA